MKRFWDSVEQKAPNECWPWKAGLRVGYGRFHINNSAVGAHRMAYELAKGPIPEGLVVMHSCDVRSCCNPVHLSVGTAGDNNTDRAKKRRNADIRGEKAPQAKLTDEGAALVRRLYANGAGGFTQLELGRCFGVSQSRISETVNFKAFLNVEKK